MGTFETDFTIPNLNADREDLRVSSVVWSGQRQPIAEAIGAGANQKLLVNHPLVYEGQKLIPASHEPSPASRTYTSISRSTIPPSRQAPRSCAWWRPSASIARPEGLRVGAGGTQRALDHPPGHAAGAVPGSTECAEAGPIHLPGERDRRNREEVRIPARAAGGSAVGAITRRPTD